MNEYIPLPISVSNVKSMADIKTSKVTVSVKPLPDKPILGSSNSAANKDVVSKIWTNGYTITCI